MRHLGLPVTPRTVGARVALCLGLVAGACGGEGAEGPEAGITIGDIVSDPTAHLGEDVAVSAEVREVFAPYAFTLKTGDTQVVLVVSADPVHVVEGSVVQAIGRLVEAPVGTGDVPPDVASVLRNVAADAYGSVFVASEVLTLEEAGDS